MEYVRPHGVEKMKLFGTEVPFILFLRWWIAELVLALYGGYFGSKGFHPEALLITGFYWLAFSALICSYAPPTGIQSTV